MVLQTFIHGQECLTVGRKELESISQTFQKEVLPDFVLLPKYIAQSIANNIKKQLY